MPKKTSSREEETELIVSAAKGSREAFGVLYEMYSRRVFRHIFFLVSSHHIAEDLTAQTFLKALEAINRYEMRGIPFLAWLLRIAYNLAANHKRIRGNHADLLPQTELPDNQRHPEALAEAGDDAKRAQELVKGLNGARQKVIIMFFYDDLSLSEIARVLGKSIGAVRALKWRALWDLRQRAAL